MWLPCICGDVYGKRGFVLRNQFVCAPDFISVPDGQRIGRAANFRDRDEVASRALCQIHDVGKIIRILLYGGSTGEAAKNNYAADEAHGNGGNFLWGQGSHNASP